jgi:hypothetical protein
MRTHMRVQSWSMCLGDASTKLRVQRPNSVNEAFRLSETFRGTEWFEVNHALNLSKALSGTPIAGAG